MRDPIMTIYHDMKAAGVPMDSHESDLYVQDTPEARAILEGYKYRCNVHAFTSQIDGRTWWDIPFAFEPFWEGKAGVTP